LNDLLLLLNSMHMRAAGKGNFILTRGQREAAECDLQTQLARLNAASVKAVDDCVGQLRIILRKKIYDTMNHYIPAASTAALDKVMRWGARPSVGGMRFMTYKVTCRRQGAFNGAIGFVDMNRQLVDPITRGIGTSWPGLYSNPSHGR
jgi:hypothetical protein